MRKTILALSTACALAGTALPVLAYDYEDDDRSYQYRYHRDNHYRREYSPYWHRHYYDNDDYRWGYRRWWWKLRHYDPDRPWIRKHY